MAAIESIGQSQTSARYIGPYRVLGSLGRGGMAEVFEVEHRHLGQIRALKVLLPEIAARADIVERLLDEARAMARLRHPAIVEVFDCDVLQDGTAFIAMECLRGEPLRLWLERAGKLSREPALAAAIVGRIAEGLAFAHRQGVVHRDLKPENILLVPQAETPGAFSVKILDFGVAKMLRDDRPRTPTLDGCVIGTPMCMAPEQWRPGAEVDHRADIYALGCLLFEALCGRPPFLEGDDVAIMHAHIEAAPPSVAALEAGLPAGFDRLISRMLAKSPADRPQSAEEVLAELEALAGRERGRWDELLRTPQGWPAVARAASLGTTQPALAVVRSSPRARVSAPGLPSRWGRTGRDRRTRVALAACLGMLATSAVAGALLLRTKDSSARSPVAAGNSERPHITAAPIARGKPQGPFRMRVSSLPAGAEAWVEGERGPRGYTPLELAFPSNEPQVIRLKAPGYHVETLLLSPEHDPVTTARLTPATPPATQPAAPIAMASPPAAATAGAGTAPAPAALANTRPPRPQGEAAFPPPRAIAGATATDASPPPVASAHRSAAAANVRTATSVSPPPLASANRPVATAKAKPPVDPEAVETPGPSSPRPLREEKPAGARSRNLYQAVGD